MEGRSMLRIGFLLGTTLLLLVAQAEAKCTITIKGKNGGGRSAVSKVGVDMSYSKVQTIGGPFISLHKKRVNRRRGPLIMLKKGKRFRRMYDLPWGCNIKRRYRFRFVNKHRKEYIYTATWTKKRELNLGDIAKYFGDLPYRPLGRGGSF